MRLRHKGEFSDSEGFNPFDSWLSGIVGFFSMRARGSLEGGKGNKQNHPWALTRGHVPSPVWASSGWETSHCEPRRTKGDSTLKVPSAESGAQCPFYPN